MEIAEFARDQKPRGDLVGFVIALHAMALAAPLDGRIWRSSQAMPRRSFRCLATARRNSIMPSGGP